MPNPINYECSTPLGSHLENDCGEELLGGVSAALLLEVNHQLTNPSDASQINAEIAAGRAKLVQGIKVGIPKPSPVEVESNIGCGASTTLVTYDRTGTIIDGNVNSTNIDFYNTVFGGRTFGGIIFYMCGTEEATSGSVVAWLNSPVKFTGGRVIPNTNNTFQTFDGDFKWRKKDDMLNYPTPVGIFN